MEIRMSDQQAKADAGKSNPLLLEQDMPNALSVINRILDYGLEKYSRKSWLKVAADRWDAACGRHRRDRYRGQVFDRESGLLHMAHEAAGLIIQIELFMQANPGIDFHTFRPAPQDHKQVSHSDVMRGVADRANWQHDYTAPQKQSRQPRDAEDTRHEDH
jgi:hypothetical protein